MAIALASDGDDSSDDADILVMAGMHFQRIDSSISEATGFDVLQSLCLCFGFSATGGEHVVAAEQFIQSSGVAGLPCLQQKILLIQNLAEFRVRCKRNDRARGLAGGRDYVVQVFAKRGDTNRFIEDEVCADVVRPALLFGGDSTSQQNGGSVWVIAEEISDQRLVTGLSVHE